MNPPDERIPFIDDKNVEAVSSPLISLQTGTESYPLSNLQVPAEMNGQEAIGFREGCLEESLPPVSFVHRRGSSFKFPLHAAAEKGKAKTLERLLKKGDPTQLDFKKRTPLHYACEFSYQKRANRMVDAILRCQLSPDKAEDSKKRAELIDFQDCNMETALHIAAKRGHALITEKLIFSGSDVNIKDKNGVEALEWVYSKAPAAMKPVFDLAVECKAGDPNDPNDMNVVLQFDFASIVGYALEDDEPGIFKLETKLLAYCLQHREQKRTAILLHPLVQTFLHLKWKKVRILLWVSILYHVIWLLLYTGFITDLYLVECPFIKGESEELEITSQESEASGEIIANSSEFETSTEPLELNLTNFYNGTGIECKMEGNLLSILNLELFLLLGCTISVVLKELYEIYSTPQLKFYLIQLENLGQWGLVTVVILTIIPVFTRDSESVIILEPWQYIAAAFGIFLAWALILSQVGKLPTFAIYIEILGKVLRSFMMFMITFASLLVAFMVSFQILMPEKQEFSQFPWNIIKMITMMVGEINYDDVFHDEEEMDKIPFPFSTKLLYAAFIGVVTIILFNLLIGLTVSDIQGLQSVAQLSNLSSQLEQIYLMEKFIAHKKLQRWLRRFNKNEWIRIFLVTQQTWDITTNMGVAVPIRKIPWNLQFQVRELSAPNMLATDDEDDGEDEDYGKSEVQNIESQDKPEDKEEPETSQNGRKFEMNEENLKRIIKGVMKECLEEMKPSKAD